MLPLVSSIDIAGCVVQIVPPVPPPGCVVNANFVAMPALTVKVIVPVLPEPVTTNVRLVPAIVGVTLAPVNWPDVNAADVPEIPAVPLYVTVPVKLVTVLLPASCAVSVIPAIAVPAVCGDEMDEIEK